MRVIITGGTGLIGRSLSNSLAADGHEVIVLTRNTNKSNGLDGKVRLEKWDGLSTTGWGGLMDGAGAVVNLVGESIAGEGFPPSRWTPERKERILQSRLKAGAALTEAIRTANQKPAVLVQSSAVGYYGTHGDQDIPEDHAAGNDFLAGICKQWEASTAEVEKMGVRRPIARTGLVMSTKGGVLPLMSLPVKLFVGGPIGSGKQQMPWIHLHDEVAALRWLMDTPTATGAYNLSAPNPLSNADLTKAMAKALGRPAFFPTPGFAFQLAFGELAVLLLEGQRAIPARLMKEGFTFKLTDAEAAFRDLFSKGH
jgi:uncharacterized protein (TIGR01777 family)